MTSQERAEKIRESIPEGLSTYSMELLIAQITESEREAQLKPGVLELDCLQALDIIKQKYKNLLSEIMSGDKYAKEQYANYEVKIKEAYAEGFYTAREKAIFEIENTTAGTKFQAIGGKLTKRIRLMEPDK